MTERRMLRRYERNPDQKQTIAEMVAWCEERGLDPARVRLVGGFHFMWESEETDEEAARRVEFHRAGDERHLAWLRKTVRDRFGVELPEEVR